ncbi:PadR family transcriptional regulator [Sedimenticola hydrogenitrophicus]|jgi:DNA-binding PadR family transcriptional regulator|uniref:PadR family transcriptional regulator n=1 Tax=Sedimenticola hydrogenitrophicus TaxID=2967975 RepID=UPI0023AE73B9|nr:PadR family transcriptional regulator [Sedimenticola hydrogenitrophicus]
MNTSQLCLGILCLGDASGYEIKKAIERTFSHFQATSYGSIYPALAKLTHQGLVSFHEQTQQKRPTKKVFTLTEAGRIQFFQTLMATEPTEQHRSDFLFLMMFAHLLPTEQNRALLEKQTAHLRSELDILERIINECPTLTPGMRFTLEYGIAANRALLRLMQGRSTALLREIDAARSPTAS